MEAKSNYLLAKRRIEGVDWCLWQYDWELQDTKERKVDTLALNFETKISWCQDLIDINVKWIGTFE
jgi:hypothetical protein